MLNNSVLPTCSTYNKGAQHMTRIQILFASSAGGGKRATYGLFQALEKSLVFPNSVKATLS